MKHLTLRAASAPALLKQFRITTLFALTLCAAVTVLVSGPGARLLTPVKAATLTVCPSGCSATTINGAIALASPGDFIQVAAGTYNEQVVVNKDNLVLIGANSGKAACGGARVAESIVGTPNGAFQIMANGVVVSSFLVQGVTGGLGAGVHASGVSGVRIHNNIIQNNVIGILLGGANHEVASNNIHNNNNPGAASGTGIYSDTGLTNSTISTNCFNGHTRAALNLIGAPVVAGTVGGITVEANSATNDAGFSFSGGGNLSISANRSSGSGTDVVRFRGGVDGATVSGNQFTNGAASGISVRNDFGGPNANIKINCNRLVGFATAAIIVDPDENTGTLNPTATAAIIVDSGGHAGALNAEHNFFGCNAGPNNPGCGAVSAPDGNLDFTPWQTLALANLTNPLIAGQPVKLIGVVGDGVQTCPFDNLPFTFTSTCGTLGPLSFPFPAEAHVTLTAGAPGACSTSVTVDNQTVTLNQTVIPPPALTSAALAGCIGPGAVLPVRLNIPNTGTTALPIEVRLNFPAGLNLLSNTCAANIPGSCTALTPTQTGFSSTVPAGQTAVLSFQVQVGDVPPNTPLCLTSSVKYNNDDRIVIASQACVTVNCAPAGPGALFPSSAEVSGEKGGSVLVYNFYSSSGAAPNVQNTRISMTNTHTTQPVAVHLFFVDSASCSVADAFICLSQNQTASFLAADFDPGTTGYIIAVASDPSTGCPLNFNYLIGDEFIKRVTGHAANLPAESIAALPGGLPVCNDNTVTAQLNFDGVSYNRLPRVLADSNIPSRADGNDTFLVINRIGGNLATGAATIGTLFGLLYDDAESGFSFGLSGGCQLRVNFGAIGTPRTTPPVSTIIPAGRTGWFKVYHQTEDIALLGAAINFNNSAGAQARSFSQGHNLHKLTLSAAATLTIPVFPPRC